MCRGGFLEIEVVQHRFLYWRHILQIACHIRLCVTVVW